MSGIIDPNADHYIQGERLPMMINVQRRLKKGLVKTCTGKVFPVTLQDWLADSIMTYDYVELKKSHVTGEWIVVNYWVNSDVAQEIEDSYNEGVCY